MQNTLPLSQVNLKDYAALFLAGGHGTMWDFPNHAVLGRLVGKPSPPTGWWARSATARPG